MTYYEIDDPHVQRIHIADGKQRNGVYEVHFTDTELTSHDMFCKGISTTISGLYFIFAFHVAFIQVSLSFPCEKNIDY